MTRRLLTAAGLAAAAALTVPAAAPASAIQCPPFTKVGPVYHPLTGQPITYTCVPDPRQLPDPCPYACDVAER